ncbi:hypothetical protein [Streptomyces zagrosensis]|uniref:Uncharacterized protein n=1 Tax=Streptomyces zagrosensis TaxID=1042984 RepID=A0A7W9Q842_9ACTN|nr:hypothetical protein [Streptomyces zagrosensis]MBB5935109.1 hypothetical protein [Streptomyces zagrosensis]
MPRLTSRAETLALAGLTCGGAAPTRATGRSASAAAGDMVSWGAFCCALMPMVLLVCGSSFGGAAGTALGLAAVTAACRTLLRRAERRAARMTAEHLRAHCARYGRTTPAERPVGHLSEGCTPVG